MGEGGAGGAGGGRGDGGVAEAGEVSARVAEVGQCDNIDFAHGPAATTDAEFLRCTAGKTLGTFITMRKHDIK